MPQISVTVTQEEHDGLQERAKPETLSNYVRGRLDLPKLLRGRGSAARANDEATNAATVERRRGDDGQPREYEYIADEE